MFASGSRGLLLWGMKQPDTVGLLYSNPLWVEEVYRAQRDFDELKRTVVDANASIDKNRFALFTWLLN